MKKVAALFGVVLALVLMIVILLAPADDADKCAPGKSSSGSGGAVNAEGLAEPEKDALSHITSGYMTPDRPGHQGVDIAKAPGEPIYAMADGLVVKAGFATGFGQWIIIDHNINGEKWSTVYGHMFEKDVLVKEGQEVKAGTHIANQGYNGEVSPPGPGGSHLHIEWWQGGKLTGGHHSDPMPWLEKAAKGEKVDAGGEKANGTNVLLIGDSISVGAQSQLEQQVPGVEVDAQVSRTFQEGLDILKNHGKAKTTVMALGTNGGVTQEQIDEAKKLAGGKLVLMTAGGPGVPDLGSTNNLVSSASGVSVIPWAKAVAGDTSLLGEDGIHPTDKGRVEFASLVAKAIKGADSSSREENMPGGELPDSDVIKSKEHLQIDTIRVARAIAQRFPEIKEIGGWRPNDPYPDHPSGRAADIMIPNWNTDEGKALGDQIRDYLFSNKDFFQIQYMIWRQQYIPASGQSNTMEDRGSPTQNHYDHVHVTTIGHGFPSGDQQYGEAPAGGSGGVGISSSDSCGVTGSIAGVDSDFVETNIPPELVKWIKLAGSICPEVPPSLVAGVVYQETKFQPGLVSPSGAQGYAQFMPDTWKGVGAKVDENGKVVGPPGSGNPFDAADGIMASGRYMCQIAHEQREQIASGKIKGDPLELMLAGYNAGPYAVLNQGGVAQNDETRPYVVTAPKYAEQFGYKRKKGSL